MSFPIFKVNKLTDKNETDVIFVFYGSYFSKYKDEDEIAELIEELNDTFEDDPDNEKFNGIFNEPELENIKKNKTDVKFVNETIHLDDSIGVIKLKIFEAISKEASMSEIYLYCLKEEKLNPITVYQNLTQNDRRPLTKVCFNQLLLNLYDSNGHLMEFNLPEKSQYNFDDILNLKLTEKTYLVGKAIGQKFVFTNEYPFISDPFLVEEYDALLEKSRKELSTLNTNLLLDSGKIFNNTIYLCLAKDVFNEAEYNDISSEYTSKIYYPFLYKDKIDTIQHLDEKRNKLVSETSDKLTEDAKQNFKNINMFYNVFQQPKPSSKFSKNVEDTGITSLKIVIYPEFKVKIPIDIIFKLIHATQDFPLIKYNPETRQENIYRLFAPELSTDGRKIPYLEKAAIYKLMRTIGKKRSVAVYTNIQYNETNIYMCCEFEDNGNINVYPLVDFTNPILLSTGKNKFEEIDTILKDTVNPLIEQIKPFFEQSGLEIPLFNSVKSSNVEIRDLKYHIVYNVTQKIKNIEDYIGCISSVFTIESNKTNQAIKMRYKRVSNFNKLDGVDAFIIEKMDQGLTVDEIKQELLTQFGDVVQDEDDANELIAKISNQLEVIRGANKRRALMIQINPGFQTIINIDRIHSKLIVDIGGINNIYYLETIPVYIDTIVRITQDINSSKIESSTIQSYCKGKEIQDPVFDKITAQSEKRLDDNSVPTIKDEESVYMDSQQEQNVDDLLDLLGQYDDESSSELEGGKGSSDEEEEDDSNESSESVSSEILTDSSSKSLSIPDNVVPENDIVSATQFQGSPEVDKFDELSDLVSLESIPKSASKKSTPEESSASKESSKKSTPEESSKSKELSESKESSESEEIQETVVMPEKATPEESEEIQETVVMPEKAKTPTPKEEIQEPIPEKPEQIQITLKKPNKKKKADTQKEIKNVAEDLENTFSDITGMSLRYPNPFSTRLEQRMPQLFVKSKDSKIDAYTRMCPFNLQSRRQPIILTKEEKDEMLREHPDEMDEEADFIEYGADSKDGSKKFYYTCPRYWCLRTNKMVTEKDILDGKCGPKVDKIEDAIIPKEAKKVPEGKYVYQFYDDKERKYPGFHKNKTPSGLCIPCCFSNWSTGTMKKRRNICQGKPDKKTAEPSTEKEREIEDEIRRRVAEAENHDYVKGPERYGPQLGEHRWGFLPIVVQKFLHEVNEDCKTSKTNLSLLKPNHLCILRHGVEVSSTQSFIACIASAMFYGQTYNKKPLIHKFIPDAKNEVPSIREMKNILIDSIDLDKFIKLQNGDLITSFSNPDLDVNLDNYKETKIYNKMLSSVKQRTKANIKDIEVVQPSSNTAKQFIIKVAQSFENFKNYLKDNKITIDHTYLWDLVSIPNPKLFPGGINLIILEIPEDDSTNNIELLCPTNHYSDHVYNARKETLILIKRENYFEPIYGYNDDGKDINITTTFSEYNKSLPKSLRSVFEKIIKPTLGEKCKYNELSPLSSRPNEYRFKQSPTLDVLIQDLQKKKFTVTLQILNFQGKVIGVLAKNKKGLEGFIPCYPSSLTLLKNKKMCKTGDAKECDYDYVYMNDDIWKSYDETLEFMKHYYKYKEPKNATNVNCYNPNYFCRVAEDGFITGFLTNTNQFVPIKNPVDITSVNDSIKTITDNDALVADINTLTNKNVDSKRADFIKRIQLETNFYNVFRNTIRILFNDYANNNKRKKIKEECNKPYSLYKAKLDIVIDMLRDLAKNSIIFASKTDHADIDNKDIYTCVSKTNNNCEKKGSVCRFTNDKCQLVLPKVNLINGTDNEIHYYGKMADELIRYNRIKSFVFKPQSYLSFGQINYNLRSDEIIVLQDLLNNEFFENLVPADINKFSKFNTYDTANPILTQMYDNEKELDDVINPYHDSDCSELSPTQITSEYWKNCFPDGYTETKYDGSNNCSMYLIIDIVKEFNGTKLTIDDVKRDLIEEYSQLTDNFTDKDRYNAIINILREEAQFDANQLQDNSMKIEEMINHSGFIAVNFDLWLLLSKYEIPSIFISSKVIPETRFNKHEFVCYSKSNEDNYVFIITPAMYRRKDLKMPIYRVIKNDKNSIKINLSKLINDKEKKINNCLNKLESAQKSYITVEEYLDEVFEKDNTTKYKQRKEGLREKKKKTTEKKKVPVKFVVTEKMVLTEDNEEIPALDKEPKKTISKKFVVEEKPVDIPIEQEQKDEIQIQIKKPKTKRHKDKEVKANPQGKAPGTKKKSGTKKNPKSVRFVVQDNP